MNKGALEDMSKFLDAAFTNQNKITSLSPAVAEPKTVPEHRMYLVNTWMMIVQQQNLPSET